MLDGTLHLRFDANTHPTAAGRIAAWRDAMGVSVEAVFKPEEQVGFSGRLDFYPLGAVLLVDSFSTPYTAVRNRQVIARSGDSHVILDIFLEGGFEGRADGRPLVIGPGDVFFMEYRGTLRAHLRRSRYLGVVMPRELFEAHTGGAKAVHGLSFEAASAEAKLLGAFLRSLVEQVSGLSEARAAAFGGALVGLIAACVARAEPAEIIWPAELVEPNLVRVRRYIDRHAMNPDLDVESLCTVFDVSRTALYRLCGCEGGVAELVRRRRAEIAKRMLGDVAVADRSLDVVARASGFTNARAMRRAMVEFYEATPSQLRQVLRDPGSARREHSVEIGALLDKAQR